MYPVGAHNSVVGAEQGFRAPSWDQQSVRDSVHEDSASARIAAGQRPRPVDEPGAHWFDIEADDRFVWWAEIHRQSTPTGAEFN